MPRITLHLHPIQCAPISNERRSLLCRSDSALFLASFRITNGSGCTMQLSSIFLALCASILSKPVFANDPIPQSVVDSQDLMPFVLASRPVWEFGVPSK